MTDSGGSRQKKVDLDKKKGQDPAQKGYQKKNGGYSQK